MPLFVPLLSRSKRRRGAVARGSLRGWRVVAFSAGFAALASSAAADPQSWNGANSQSWNGAAAQVAQYSPNDLQPSVSQRFSSGNQTERDTLGPPRLRGRYTVSVSAHDLGDVLSEFSRAVQLTPQISSLVSGRVDAQFENETGASILNTLGREFGFDWWLDGEILRVTDRSERVSRLLSLEGVRMPEIESVMRSLELWEAKFPISNDGARIAYVSGPPAYVALVELITADLAEKRALEAAAFKAAEEVRAEEFARRQAQYDARRQEEARLRAQRLAAYETRRQEMIRRIEEAARLRALWEMRRPLVLRGGAGGS